MRAAENLGRFNLLFETDYPQVGSLEADEVEWTINEGLAKIPDDASQRVLWQNAAELYQLETLLTPIESVTSSCVRPTTRGS